VQEVFTSFDARISSVKTEVVHVQAYGETGRDGRDAIHGRFEYRPELECSRGAAGGDAAGGLNVPGKRIQI
jgi:hypothetical protein